MIMELNDMGKPSHTLDLRKLRTMGHISKPPHTIPTGRHRRIIEQVMSDHDRLKPNIDDDKDQELQTGAEHNLPVILFNHQHHK